MNPNVIKIVGTLVAAALGVLAYVGVEPVPSELSASLATLLVGWLHIKQPGTIKA